jgi:hypothetical protein
LIVNLQDTTEFASQQLNRDTWKDSAVQSLIEAQCVFWQSARQALDAQRFSTRYNIGTYPATALIDPRTDEMVRVWYGFVDPEKLSDECESRSLSCLNDVAAPRVRAQCQA